MSSLPTSTRAVVLRKSEQIKDSPYDDAVLEERSLPTLSQDDVLVELKAFSFNHRDVWIRKGLYPGIKPGTVLGSDAAGVVIGAADPKDKLIGKRVFLVPMRGWEHDFYGPESAFGILGGVKFPEIGAFADYVVVSKDQVILTPDHLDDKAASAWPLGGVTAWRSVVTHGQVKEGDNVFITGIGGGVALLSLQICVAAGANVYVSSSSQEKIKNAVALGARAGVNYKSQEWSAELAALLKQHSSSSSKPPLLDIVVDSAGGEIMAHCSKVLKAGGKVIVYGMTAVPKITFTMREVLKGHQLIGTSMGSHKELQDATDFIAKHKVQPHVTNVINGLANYEQGFTLMMRGTQFGKIVVTNEEEKDQKSLL